MLGALDELGGGRVDLRADVPGARERDQSHPGVVDEPVTGDLAGARHVVQHARRQPGLGEEAHELGRDHRGLLGGLEDHRVAGRQGRARHARQDRQREVPRRDDGDHAAGLPQVVVDLAPQLAQPSGPQQLGRLPAVVFDEVDRLGDVGVRLPPGLARLVDDPGGQLRAPLAHELRGSLEHPRAFRGASVAPPGEGLLGRCHRAVDILGRGGGGAPDDLVRSRRVPGEQALGGLDGGAADHERVLATELLAHRGQSRREALPHAGEGKVGVGLVREARE